MQSGWTYHFIFLPAIYENSSSATPLLALDIVSIFKLSFLFWGNYRFTLICKKKKKKKDYRDPLHLFLFKGFLGTSLVVQ